METSTWPSGLSPAAQFSARRGALSVPCHRSDSGTKPRRPCPQVRRSAQSLACGCPNRRCRSWSTACRLPVPPGFPPPRRECSSDSPARTHCTPTKYAGAAIGVAEPFRLERNLDFRNGVPLLPQAKERVHPVERELPLVAQRVHGAEVLRRARNRRGDRRERPQPASRATWAVFR